jgi:hypothetical protein
MNGAGTMADPAILPPFVLRAAPDAQVMPLKPQEPVLRKPLTPIEINTMLKATGTTLIAAPQASLIITPSELVLRDASGSPTAIAELGDVQRLWYVFDDHQMAVTFHGQTGSLIVGPGPLAHDRSVLITLDMGMTGADTATAKIRLQSQAQTQTNTLHRNQPAIVAAIFPKGGWGAFEITCDAAWTWSHCQMTLL